MRDRLVSAPVAGATRGRPFGPRALGLALACVLGGCFGVDSEAPPTGCRTNSECAAGTLCDAASLACVPETADFLSGGFTCDVNADPATYPGSEVLGRVGEERTFFAQGAQCELAGTELTVSFYQARADRLLRVAVALAPGREQFAIGAPTESYLWPTSGAGVAAVIGADSAIEAYATGGSLVLLGTPLSGAKLQGRLSVTLGRPGPAAGVGRPCPGGVVACGPDSTALCAARDTAPICDQPCAVPDECPAGTACLEGACLVACQSQSACPPGLACRPTETIGEGACY